MSSSGISWAVCKSAPRSREITMPAPHYSVFYRPDALPAAQSTAIKHWWQNKIYKIPTKYFDTVTNHIERHPTMWVPRIDNNSQQTQFLQAGCSSWHPTNSVRELKAVAEAGIVVLNMTWTRLLVWSVDCLIVATRVFLESADKLAGLPGEASSHRWRSMRPVYTWNDVSRTSKRENNSALRCWLGLPILVACNVGLPWAANCDADRLGGYGRHGDGVSNCFCQFINVLSVSLKIISTGRMHTELYFHVFLHT